MEKIERFKNIRFKKLLVSPIYFVLAFNVASCTNATLLGNKSTSSSTSSLTGSSSSSATATSALAKPLAGYAALSGGGISTGKGIMAIASVGQPLSSTTGAYQKSTTTQTISNIQGSFYQVVGQ